MSEWYDTTIVAIASLPNRKYRVLELPARSTNIIKSRQQFANYNAAKAYVVDQYPDAELFTASDLKHEKETREELDRRHNNG